MNDQPSHPQYPVSRSRQTPPGRAAIIGRELLRLNIDVAALSGTKLPGNDELVRRKYSYLFSGIPDSEELQEEVAIAIRSNVRHSIQSWKAVSPKIVTARQHHATIIAVYAPTLRNPEEEKTAFYDDLHHTMDGVPKKDFIILMGDFNARVGRDHTIWPDVTGHFGIGSMNDNT